MLVRRRPPPLLLLLQGGPLGSLAIMQLDESEMAAYNRLSGRRHLEVCGAVRLQRLSMPVTAHHAHVRVLRGFHLHAGLEQLDARQPGARPGIAAVQPSQQHQERAAAHPHRRRCGQ